MQKSLRNIVQRTGKLLFPTHRWIFLWLPNLRQFNSPPFRIIPCMEECFRAYLSWNSKFDEEKSRLPCSGKLCRTYCRASSYRTLAGFYRMSLRLWTSPVRRRFFWNRPKNTVEDDRLTDFRSRGHVLRPRTLQVWMNRGWWESLAEYILIATQFVVRGRGGRTEPLIQCHGHHFSACLWPPSPPLFPLTAATTTSPDDFPDWTLHMCRLHVSSANLNVTELVRIPRSYVIGWGWPVDWPLIPFNSNHFYRHAAFKI